MKPVITALVPMRHTSERVPGKNYRLFAGIPLFHRVVHTLLNCPEIDQIVIDTDSPFILADVEANFPEVTLIERPEHLRNGNVPMNAVIMHDVGIFKSDFYLQTHSTNPLLKADTVSAAIRKFLNSFPNHDSLFSVTRLQTRLWDEIAGAINHDPDKLLRTQDLPPVYEENSCMYIFSRETIETRNNRIGARPIMFEIDRMEAFDIDEELDFEIAQILYRKLNSGKGS